MRAPTVAITALLALALAGDDAPGAAAARQLIVAAGPEVASALAPDGSWAVELPWLLPGDTNPTVSPDGTWIAFTSSRHGNPEVYVADTRTSAVRRLTVNPRADDRHPAWSPDGRRIVWQSGRPGAFDLYVMDADGSRKRRLVTGPGDDVEADWAPDGTRIAFSSNRSGRRDLWAVAADGGAPELLGAVPGAARAPSWSPDGRRVAFSRESAGDADIWLLDVASGAQRRVTRGPGWDGAPDWSPDGRRVAFTRARAGAVALWTARADGSSSRRVPGSRGARGPAWVAAPASLAPAPGELLPDLDQRAPSGLVVVLSDGRFRLGFDSATENRGRGPLVIRGVREAGARFMRAHQVIESRGGGTRLVRDVGRLHYERHEPHFHWHLQDFVRYELRSAATRSVVARDRKTGFCLIDRYGRAVGNVPGTGAPRFVGDCASGRPDAQRVVEGSSVGYVDRYPALFHGQDLDLTGLPAGLYTLVHRANPDRTMRELRYSNNDASVLLRLAWPDGTGAAPVVRVLRRCPGSAACGTAG